MALKKPKSPKYKSLPRKPKQSASDDSWKRYMERAKDVQKENNRRKKAYNAALKSYNDAVKHKKKLREEARNMKKVSV